MKSLISLYKSLYMGERIWRENSEKLIYEEKEELFDVLICFKIRIFTRFEPLFLSTTIFLSRLQNYQKYGLAKLEYVSNITYNFVEMWSKCVV